MRESPYRQIYHVEYDRARLSRNLIAALIFTPSQLRVRESSGFMLQTNDASRRSAEGRFAIQCSRNRLPN